MGVRARSFAERLNEEFQIHIAYRAANKIQAIFRFLATLLRVRPALCYVFDMGFSGVMAAAIYRALSQTPVIIDTGDAIYELSRLTGNRSRLSLWLTKLLEETAFFIRRRVVVRSHPHQEMLAARGIQSDVIPDGVDTTQFRPQPQPAERHKLGLDGFMTVGLLGSVIWNRKWNMCYGWELVELIHRLRDLPVKGILIGDGDGVPYLKKQCADYGIEDRVLFLGRLPYHELPRFLNVMDICLSTQTNDAAGQVRTTGKLPLYLACGRFVLATAVGEAARVLPPAMLLPYDGTKDVDYPDRLSARVRDLLSHQADLEVEQISTGIARGYFDYSVLAQKLRKTIRKTLDKPSESID